MRHRQDIERELVNQQCVFPHAKQQLEIQRVQLELLLDIRELLLKQNKISTNPPAPPAPEPDEKEKTK